MLISITNTKGGVGKSTLAVHLAAWLRAQHLDVAVVDADRQRSTSDWLRRAAPDVPIHQPTCAPDILRTLPGIIARHDVVIADSPAALGAEIAALVTLSDLCLLPIGASMLDVWASFRVARMIYRVRFADPAAPRPQAFAILTRVVADADVTRVAAAAVHHFGFPIALTPVHFRTAYLEAAAQGTVVERLGPAGRQAAAEMHALFDEVLEITTRPPGSAAASTATAGV